jgi:hypothetical protein
MKQQFVQMRYPSSSFRVSFHIRTEHFPTDAEWQAYADCATAVTPLAHRNSSM